MPKVAFLPLYSVQRPSSRYRLFQFLESFEQAGWQYSILPAPERNPKKRLAYLFRLFPLAISHDVIYIQKRMLPYWVMRVLQLTRHRLVYDLDDAVYLRTNYRHKVERMIRMVDVAIVGNSTLANYARSLNREVVVIPTVVDTIKCKAISSPRHPGDDRIIIGWIGSDPNRGDFTTMKPVFDWLGEQYGRRVVFRSIGTRPLDIDTCLELEFIQWTLEHYQSELKKFDIGIMPLADTPWNRGKCGFKLIQYMAVGTAAVASPVGVNQEIIEEGVNGYLAQNVDEWQEKLSFLIEDDVERDQIGNAARKRIESEYSVGSVFPLLLDTLNSGLPLKVTE